MPITLDIGWLKYENGIVSVTAKNISQLNNLQITWECLTFLPLSAQQPINTYPTRRYVYEEG
jgi:hypothetical protein